MTPRIHLFPFRTQKLSLVVPTILGWQRPGKIGRRRSYIYSSLAQSVERSAVNRNVVGSSPTRGAKKTLCSAKSFFIGSKTRGSARLIWLFHAAPLRFMSAQAGSFRQIPPKSRRFISAFKPKFRFIIQFNIYGYAPLGA